MTMHKLSHPFKTLPLHRETQDGEYDAHYESDGEVEEGVDRTATTTTSTGRSALGLVVARCGLDMLYSFW
jgi:hypothetical protein